MIDRDALARILAYDPETGILTWLVPRNNNKIRAGARAGRLVDNGYRQIQVDGVVYAEHRIAWLLMTGELPAAEIDHRNLSRADNRWTNLRLATRAQQVANSRRNSRNTSGHKGAYWIASRRRWCARIDIGGKIIGLGSYQTAAEAGAAYAAAAAKLHGEFARAA